MILYDYIKVVDGDLEYGAWSPVIFSRHDNYLPYIRGDGFNFICSYLLAEIIRTKSSTYLISIF